MRQSWKLNDNSSTGLSKRVKAQMPVEALILNTGQAYTIHEERGAVPGPNAPALPPPVLERCLEAASHKVLGRWELERRRKGSSCSYKQEDSTLVSVLGSE